MILFSVDFELSHPDLSLGFAVQLGFCAFDTETQQEVDHGSWMLMQPYNKLWDQETYERFWSVEGKGKSLLERYQDPKTRKVHAALAIQSFLEKLDALRQTGKKLMFIGDALSVDMPWLKMLLELYVDVQSAQPRCPYHLADPKKYQHILQVPDFLRGRASIGLDDRRTDYWKANERLFGLEPFELAPELCEGIGRHDALYDARALVHRFGRLYPHLIGKARRSWASDDEQSE